MRQEKKTTALAQRIETIRKGAGLSVIGLAQLLGVHRSYIYKLERGEASNPSQDFASRLKEKLGVDLSWLLTGEGERPGLKTMSPIGNSMDRRYELRVSDSSVLTILESLVADFGVIGNDRTGVNNLESSPAFLRETLSKESDQKGVLVCFLTASLIGAVVNAIRLKDPKCALLRAVPRNVLVEELFQKINPLIVGVLTRHALKVCYGQQLADEVFSAIKLTFHNPPDSP
jgi:transcriptional regulator with XRE-family HTH domain